MMKYLVLAVILGFAAPVAQANDFGSMFSGTAPAALQDDQDIIISDADDIDVLAERLGVIAPAAGGDQDIVSPSDTNEVLAVEDVLLGFGAETR